MEKHVSGHSVLVGKLRHALAASMVGNPLSLLHEQFLANRRNHEGRDGQPLNRWLANPATALAHQPPAPLLSPILLAVHVV